MPRAIVKRRRPEKGVSFGKVWAALMEDRRESRRRAAEAERRSRELDRRMHETDVKVDKMCARIDKLGEQYGGVSNALGEAAESFFASETWRYFEGLQYHFQRLFQRLPIYDDQAVQVGDIDLTLLDGDTTMAIEVKSHLRVKNVEYHAKRMDLIKKYPPLEYVGKKILGAVAGLSFEAGAKERAYELGFYVLEQTGEAVRLAKLPKDFKPREW